MTYTLGMAARATGLSKSTIYRAIKAGRISAAPCQCRYEDEPHGMMDIYWKREISENVHSWDSHRHRNWRGSLHYQFGRMGRAQNRAHKAQLNHVGESGG